MLLRCGQRPKFCQLFGLEKLVGNFQRRLARPAVLNVDSNDAVRSNTEQNETPRMRNIKSDLPRPGIGIHYLGLSVSVRGERPLMRCDCDVLRQYCAYQCACDEIPAPID